MWVSERLQLLSSALLLTPHLSHAFYLPGVAPTSYDPEQKVPLHVNHLTPAISPYDEQLHSVLSYDYYHPAFHFCEPEGHPQDVRESLGSILFGDRIRTSPFELFMAKNETCKPMCGPVKFDGNSAEFVNDKIWQGFNINWLIDGLPAAQVSIDPQTDDDFYSPGFLLGNIDDSDDGQPVLHNHYKIVVEYHKVGGLQGADKFRVVGVVVVPESVRDSKIVGDGTAECPAESPPLVLNEEGETNVAWTYSVYWVESKTAWATRWDKYLHVIDPNVHWYSLIYSSIFVILLVALVSTILLRALKKDIARYNRLDMINLDDLNDTSATVEDGIQEDSGWKLVHGDVFRCPKNPLILSVFLGNGAQLCVMTGCTVGKFILPYLFQILISNFVVFALFGLLSPSNRGFLGTAILILYTLLGFVGGYVSARTYKCFGGDAWKQLIVFTPLMLPVVVFSTFFFLNFFVWIKGSSGAVPFTTMLVTVLIWFVISVPLSVVGSWVGFKQTVCPHSLNLIIFCFTNQYDSLSKDLRKPTRFLVKYPPL